MELSLARKEKALLLTIHDNGHGFDLREVLAQERNKIGLGLESMKERVEMSAGSFTIVSNKTKGTTLKAVWPLPEQPAGITDA